MNELREFDKRSKYFLLGDQDMLLILITSSHDNVWILLRDNCCWSLLVLKELKEK